MTRKPISFESFPHDWWLIRSPYPVSTSLLLYLSVVIVGPRMMKSRESFQLKTVLRIYNVLQVLQNAYLLLSIAFYPKYSVMLLMNICEVPENSRDFERMTDITISYAWNFLLSKILDLFDTGFMVLKKNNSHITFLHVYHHVAMAFFTWYTFRYTIFYHTIIPGIINTFVHTVMYSYYFLATFSRLKKRLWWKRYLTRLQIAQFVIILSYLSLIYYIGCPISLELTYIWLFNVFVIMLMFIDFYVKSYVFKKPTSNVEDKSRKCE